MKLLILMKQDLKNVFSNPSIMMFCFIYPTALVLLFGFLFSDMYKSDIVTSYDFYGITMIFYLILQSATITPTVFMEERTKKGNLRIAYAPVSRIQIYTSKLITVILVLTVSFLIHIAFLGLTGIVNFGGNNTFIIMILFFLLMLFMVTLGGAVCTLIKSEDLTNKIVGITVNCFAVVSGIFFPVEMLGEFAGNVANATPVKMTLNKIFEIIYDNSYANLRVGNWNYNYIYSNIFNNNSQKLPYRGLYLGGIKCLIY